MRYVRRRLHYTELFTAQKMYIGLDVSVEIQRRAPAVDQSTLTVENVAVAESAVETMPETKAKVEEAQPTAVKEQHQNS